MEWSTVSFAMAFAREFNFSPYEIAECCRSSCYHSPLFQCWKQFKIYIYLGSFYCIYAYSSYISNIPKFVLCHIIRIYVCYFPSAVFAFAVACASAPIVFCNKIFILKSIRFIRINGGFVRLHCICITTLQCSIRLIRVKRIIRWQKGIIELAWWWWRWWWWYGPEADGNTGMGMMVGAHRECNQYVVVNISVCRKSIAKILSDTSNIQIFKSVFETTHSNRNNSQFKMLYVWNA